MPLHRCGLAIGLLVWSGVASAQPAVLTEPTPEPTPDPRPAPNPAPSLETDFGWSYWVDGGAIPFVYGSALVAATTYLFAAPPDQPRGFAAAEGGTEKPGDTIPDGYVAVFAVAAIGTLGLLPSDARWYHLKGITEALLTTAALTEVTKNFFGRHRPSFDPATSTDQDDRKSFFSGHASLTLAATTYLGLYLHDHILGGLEAQVWEPIALAGLAAASIYVPYTRWADHMHHTSDLVVGAGVGMATAAGFYLWQERRYQRSRRTRPAQSKDGLGQGRLLLLPDLERRSLTLIVTF